MKNPEYISKSFVSALGTVVYVAAVALLLSHGQAIFGNDSNNKSFLIPIFMLLLFVISAAITATLVLGRPIQLYLAGTKKEGITLFFANLAWLVVFLFVVGAILIAIK